LIRVRKSHPCLRSDNFYPPSWSGSRRDQDGFGVDSDQGIVVYHRWGDGTNGQLERFIIALNFSDRSHQVTLSFPENGDWADLLSGDTVRVAKYRLDTILESNWGHIYFLG
jgi:hypothetical protein